MNRSTDCGNTVVLDSSHIRSLYTTEEHGVIDDKFARNPLFVKSRGVNNACLPNHWDSKSKKGKRNVESLSHFILQHYSFVGLIFDLLNFLERATKCLKKKGQTNTHHLQETTNVLPSQEATSDRFLSNASIHHSIGQQFGAHQHYLLHHMSRPRMYMVSFFIIFIFHL